MNEGAVPQMPETVDRIDYIVVPAIQKLLSDTEFEHLSIETEGNKLAVLLAKIRAGGETFSIVMHDSRAEETMIEAKERFFDQLQSEIAESSFGWGQLRE